MNRPLLAITLGDPAGIGPETIVGAWREPRFHEYCRAVTIGHPEILRRAIALLGSAARIVEVTEPAAVESSAEIIPCLRCGSDDAASVTPARIDPRGGQAAYDALVAAAELARAGAVDAITTGPLNKAALWAAGHQYPGHTELLAELCGVQDFAMMLYLAPGRPVMGRVGLGVAHVTLHMALRDVFANLTPERIFATTQLAHRVSAALLTHGGISDQPRIGVCALNPHAGEQGLFGDEEERIIRVAVDRARTAGVHVEGPLPTDTLMVRAAAGQFDAVVAMYHDQGHIALKLLGMHRAVNITLGLPIIRTSVAHGTAFDLAWQGKAETSGMVEAVRVAAQLVNVRSR